MNRTDSWNRNGVTDSKTNLWLPKEKHEWGDKPGA